MSYSANDAYRRGVLRGQNSLRDQAGRFAGRAADELSWIDLKTAKQIGLAQFHRGVSTPTK